MNEKKFRELAENFINNFQEKNGYSLDVTIQWQKEFYKHCFLKYGQKKFKSVYVWFLSCMAKWKELIENNTTEWNLNHYFYTN